MARRHSGVTGPYALPADLGSAQLRTGALLMARPYCATALPTASFWMLRWSLRLPKQVRLGLLLGIACARLGLWHAFDSGLWLEDVFPDHNTFMLKLATKAFK